jgi:hypothetical protein
MALKIIITEVLGWNMEEKRQESLGLFGKIDAFSCSIEEQGRSTLHAHFLIWISEMNEIRDKLHDPYYFAEASEYITTIMDKISSTACYFNEIPNDEPGRHRFVHDCNTYRYGLPTFATDEELKLLRSNNTEDNQFIQCKHCDQKCSYNEIQDLYLRHYINIPNFTSMKNENTVRRLKSMAVEYQKNNTQTEISKYVMDFGYNVHSHTKSCFKRSKGDKKNVISGITNDCRYRLPQRQKSETIIHQ